VLAFTIAYTKPFDGLVCFFQLRFARLILNGATAPERRIPPSGQPLLRPRRARVLERPIHDGAPPADQARRLGVSLESCTAASPPHRRWQAV
jgi:hypothetical protein